MSDRAISAILNYAMVLGIIALLTTGLVGAMGGLLASQGEETARSTLTVAGNDLAADLERADRLAADEHTELMTLEATLPDRVADSDYRIEIGQDEILLRSTAPDVTVRVDYRTDRDVAETTVDGGDLRISYDPAGERLVVGDG